MSSGTQSENEDWNETHLTLVRDLERKGILWRYGVKHLKLWTDMIVDGNLSGVGEEPEWSEHLEAIVVPPKSRRSTSPQSLSMSSSSSTVSTGQPANLMEIMVLNQQSMEADSRRSEMLQTTLLSIISSNVAMLQSKVLIALPFFAHTFLIKI